MENDKDSLVNQLKKDRKLFELDDKVIVPKKPLQKTKSKPTEEDLILSDPNIPDDFKEGWKALKNNDLIDFDDWDS